MNTVFRFFKKDWMYMINEIIHSHSGEIFLFQRYAIFSSRSPFKIESPIITKVPGDRYLGLTNFYLVADFDTYQKLVSFVIVLAPAAVLGLFLTVCCMRVLPLLLVFHLNQTITLKLCLKEVALWQVDLSSFDDLVILLGSFYLLDFQLILKF